MIRNLRKKKVAKLAARRSGQRAAEWFLIGLIDAMRGDASSARLCLVASRASANRATAGVLG